MIQRHNPVKLALVRPEKDGVRRFRPAGDEFRRLIKPAHGGSHHRLILFSKKTALTGMRIQPTNGDPRFPDTQFF